MFTLDKRLADSTFLIAEWPLSTVLLSKNAAFTWFILVPRVKGATELIDLSTEQQYTFLKESNSLSRWMQAYFKPDKLNIAAIGNIVAQLHVHHVARYKNDPAWPQPIWGHVARGEYQCMAVEEIKQQVKAIELN